MCERSNQQGINLQNIQRAHAALCQENKQPNQKMGSRSSGGGGATLRCTQDLSFPTRDQTHAPCTGSAES